MMGLLRKRLESLMKIVKAKKKMGRWGEVREILGELRKTQEGSES